MHPRPSFFLERKKRGNMKIALLLIAFLLFFAAASVIAGFYVFRGYLSQPEDLQIELSLNGPNELSSGSEASFTLTASNRSKTALRNISVRLKHSSGFVDWEADMQPSENASESRGEIVWNKDALNATETQTLKLKARLIAQEASMQFLSADLYYTPENFSSEFKKSVRKEIAVLPSSIGFDIKGPQNTTLEEEVSYTLEYENRSEKDRENLKFQWIFPENFVVVNTTPATKEDAGTFLLPKVKAQEKGSISVNGRFSQIAEEELEMKAQLFSMGKVKYALEAEKSLSIKLASKGVMSVSLLLNGSTENKPISFGKTMDFSFIYSNESGRELSNIELVAVIEPSAKELLDIGNITEAYVSEKNEEKGALTLSWNKKSSSKLEKLGFGEKGVWNISIPLAGKEIVKTLTREQAASLQIKSYMYAVIPTPSSAETDKKLLNKKQDTPSLKITSNAFSTLVNSDISFENSVSEPKTNETDETLLDYELTWTIVNSMHDIEKLEISAVLPQAILWQNRYEVSAGTLFFDDNAKIILWELNRLPRSLSDPIVLRLNISVPEALANMGQIIVEEATLKGTDTVTKERLEMTIPAVNTKEAEQ